MVSVFPFLSVVKKLKKPRTAVVQTPDSRSGTPSRTEITEIALTPSYINKDRTPKKQDIPDSESQPSRKIKYDE